MPGVRDTRTMDKSFKVPAKFDSLDHIEKRKNILDLIIGLYDDD